MTKSLAERFWSKVKKTDGCWLWTGCVWRESAPYGQIHVDGKTRRAHRVSWELTHRKMAPAGMFICHACDNPRCVNPDHLWIGTRSENMLDAASKKRIPLQNNSHCKNGHLFAGENLKPIRGRNRVCRICAQEQDRAYRSKKRAAAIDAAQKEGK